MLSLHSSNNGKVYIVNESNNIKKMGIIKNLKNKYFRKKEVIIPLVTGFPERNLESVAGIYDLNEPTNKQEGEVIFQTLGEKGWEDNQYMVL